MKTPSVIVIGAGVGGLAAAARLARQGLHVTVLEKNARPGGRCDRLSREGHHFDTGPTLLVMPLLYDAEFAVLGASAREMLDLKRVDPTYHLVFDDGQKLALTSDLDTMRAQLESMERGSYPRRCGGCRRLPLPGPHWFPRSSWAGASVVSGDSDCSSATPGTSRAGSWPVRR